MSDFPSLDNGSRSKCCYAPIRLGYKTNAKTKLRLKIWICTRCKTRDVDILSKQEIKSQISQVPNEEIQPDESAL